MPEMHAEWDAYVERHPRSTCHHLRAWHTAAQSAYQLEAPFLVTRSAPGAPISGALPLYVCRNMARSHMTNGLFGAYGPILADSIAERDAMIEHATRVSSERNLSWLILKTLNEPEVMADSGFRNISSWVIATLALDPDPEKIWRGFRDKVRNCVRKAKRFELEVRSGPDQFDAFYEVLAENMHSKGVPIYGAEFIRALAEALGPRHDIITLWRQDRPVAGAFLILHRDVASVPFASSRPSSLSMCPNNLLYWEIIRRSCLRGMRTLDFGRSQLGSGSLAFKLGWGARTLPQECHVLSIGGAELDLNTNDPKVEWFVRQWRKLPRMLTDPLGPMICKRVAGIL